MEISKALLAILACPATRQGLHIATTEELADINSKVALGTLVTVSGDKIIAPLEVALVRDDGIIAYRIQDEIPILLADEGLKLKD